MNRCLFFIFVCSVGLSFAEDWRQGAGPNFNWVVKSAEAPLTEWSVVRGENILWKTILPEGGQSAVSVSDGRAFLTIHRPIEEKDERTEPNVMGICLHAETGEILWEVPLPGTDPVQMAGIFSDATVFAPAVEGERVWFFNRCGSMGCFNVKTGEQIWLREFKPRPRHTNRQCEPVLVGDIILTVEVKDKNSGKLLKRHKPVPEGIDPKDVWTYLHAIDKNTGKIRWVGTAGTSVHNTPVVGKMADGTVAVVHGRGGGHGPLEKPYGVSLTRVDDGKTLWTFDSGKGEASYHSHWDSRHVYWWRGKEHLVIDTNTGKLLRSQNVCDAADFCHFDAKAQKWAIDEGVKVAAGKKMPLTNQTNILVGDWHYFLAHDIYAIGRVNVMSGKAEYLQLPAQLIADASAREKDRRIWDKKSAPGSSTFNSRGIDIALDKRAKGTGWGHVSAASPTLVNQYLFVPTLSGTVYIIDTAAEKFDEKSLVSINDLGAAGETWSLASLTFSDGRFFAHTMKEVIAIGSLGE